MTTTNHKPDAVKTLVAIRKAMGMLTKRIDHYLKHHGKACACARCASTGIYGVALRRDLRGLRWTVDSVLDSVESMTPMDPDELANALAMFKLDADNPVNVDAERDAV